MAHKQWSSSPPMQIDGSRQYVATLETTKGPIKVKLLVGEAPSTVNNFVFLAREATTTACPSTAS